MRLLKSIEQAVVPARNPAPPVVIIIENPAKARHFLSQASNIPTHQQTLVPPYKTIRPDSRIRQLIEEERSMLQDAFDDFGTAGKHLIGTLISWIVWRIVVPLSVLSALWLAFAESAELSI